MPTLNRTTGVAAALLIAMMSLVGCSSGDDAASPRQSAGAESGEGESGDSQGEADGGEQTNAEACTQLQSSIAGLQEELTSSLGSLQNDPAAASAAVTELSDTFSASVDDLTNDEVQTAAQPADDALGELADALEAYVADPAGTDPQSLTTAAGSLQDSFRSLQEACT